MGTLAHGPLSAFVEGLAKHEGYPAFIETGTYVGETALWASQIFPHVFSIEKNPEFLKQAHAACAGRDNIRLFLGESAGRLPEILAEANGPAIFWLDAHAGGGWFADKDECPLVEELRLIAARDVEDDLIIIDDARGFTAPPPPPFDPDVWPPLHAVLDAADASRKRYTVLIEDAIISAPMRLRSSIIEFCAKARPTIDPPRLSAFARLCRRLFS